MLILWVIHVRDAMHQAVLRIIHNGIVNAASLDHNGTTLPLVLPSLLHEILLCV